MKNLGFIGMGNMAKALAAGFIRSGEIEAEHVFAYAPHQDKLKANAEKIGFVPADSVATLLSSCDTLIMACKPHQIEGVLNEAGDGLKGKALISIAAGWDFAAYGRLLDRTVRFQFVMPNTPAMVGEGVLLFEKTNSLEQEERKQIMDLFSTVGLVEELPASLMGIGGALTGCGPAFADMMMEAYGDAAVKYGLPREDAYRLAAQMLLGSARLQLETKSHPGVLKDAVCSPGGTTIRGVAALEKNGFRNACMQSIDAIMGEQK